LFQELHDLKKYEYGGGTSPTRIPLERGDIQSQIY